MGGVCPGEGAQRGSSIRLVTPDEHGKGPTVDVSGAHDPGRDSSVREGMPPGVPLFGRPAEVGVDIELAELGWHRIGEADAREAEHACAPDHLIEGFAGVACEGSRAAIHAFLEELAGQQPTA